MSFDVARLEWLGANAQFLPALAAFGCFLSDKVVATAFALLFFSFPHWLMLLQNCDLSCPRRGDCLCSLAFVQDAITP